MSRTGRFLHGVWLGYAYQGLIMLVGLWLTPFLLRHIGQHDYGVWLDFLQAGPWWYADAACKEHPELSWFPERDDPSTVDTQAKRVCEGCRSYQPCREFALAAPDILEGIWGGTSELDRREIRSGRRAA